MKKSKYLQLFWSMFLFLVLGCSGGDEDSTIKVTSISVSPTSLSMDVDDSDNLSAVIMPSDAYNKDVTWTSDNQSVATVNDIGSVKAIAPGEANIKVITRDGAKSAVCKVTVKKPDQTYVAVESIALDKSTLTLGVDNTTTLSATILPENASITTTTWNTSDKDVVTVDKGSLKAIKPGTATITVAATDGGLQATCVVTVESVNVTSVELNQNSTSVDIGEFIQLVATIEPENASNKNMSWSSSDTKVATVDASGKVTGVDKGTSTITVTTENGNKKATCEVEVIRRVSGVSLPASASVEKGATIELKATIIPADPTDPALIWSSADKSIATVTDNGIVEGIRNGKTTISVKTNDGNFVKNCQVTVTTNNLIPLMTSNTSPSGVASAKDEVFPGGPAYLAFDGDDNTAGGGGKIEDGATWLIYEFETGVIINRYKYLSATKAGRTYPTSYLFQGSNGSSWETLDSRSGISDVGPHEYIINNNKAYSKYRLFITEANSDILNVVIQTLEMGYVAP